MKTTSPAGNSVQAAAAYPVIPFCEFLGLRIEEMEVDRAVVSVDVEDKHMNSMRVSHGGVLLSAMDLACGMAAALRKAPEPRRRTVTVSLTTQFIAPVRAGRLTVAGRCVADGRSVVYCEAEARDGEDRLVGTATGAFRVVRDPPEGRVEGT